jgi:predicted O-methyltransferase YrrM
VTAVLGGWPWLIRYAPQLRVLPPRVALFHLRARIAALRAGDEFSLASATRAADVAVLLKLAKGRHRVVELGTATAWTALSLVLDDPGRTVITYDPIDRPERERYLRLVSRRDRDRVVFVTAPGADGPRGTEPVDLLYIDSTHDREGTIHEIQAWRPVLGPDAIVVLDDYAHPGFPGVREAVQELNLVGEQRGTMFVHRVQGPV